MAQIAPQAPQPVPPAPQPVPPTPHSDSDWTAQAADRIEAVVVAVRDNTTVPVQQAARAVVYGLFALVMATVALVLFVIGIFRLHVYLPFGNEARRVWVAYLILAAIFLLAGGFLLRKRTAPAPKE